MRRLSISITLLAASLIAVPAAFAAYTRASDLFLALQTVGKPHDATMEVHARYQDYLAALWIKGSSQGSTLQDVRLESAITTDVVWPEGNIRMKTRVRIVDGLLYAIIDSIEGKYPDEYTELVRGMPLRQWFSLTIDKLTTSQTVTLTAEQREFFDALFSVSAIVSNERTMYSVTLRREALRELLKSLRQMNTVDMLGPVAAQKIRRSPPSVRFALKVNFGPSNVFESLSYEASMQHSLFGLSMAGTSTMRTSPVTVEIPANAISLDETAEEFSPTLRSLTSQDAASSSSASPISSGSTASPICPPNAGAAAVRRGLCHYAR